MWRTNGPTDRPTRWLLDCTRLRIWTWGEERQYTFSLRWVWIWKCQLQLHNIIDCRLILSFGPNTPWLSKAIHRTAFNSVLNAATVFPHWERHKRGSDETERRCSRELFALIAQLQGDAWWPLGERKNMKQLYIEKKREINQENLWRIMNFEKYARHHF